MVLIYPTTASPCRSPTPLLSAGGAQEEETMDMASIHLPLPLPLTLSFSNLNYCVKIRHSFTQLNIFNRSSHLSAKEPESKVLLNDISGEAHDGEILAVLGPSGSGKSTLIDALANRIADGSLKGMIKLNGEQLDSNLVKVISAYVMQDDLLFPMLTVEETLMFAAEFRLPRTLSKSKKQKRVQDLIDQLDLRNAAQTVIGDEGHRGVSGGERRRVSIGIDIIHDPILLFLDEPTTGLDSTSAFNVVKVLQRIAQTGSIVITSIHQPSYRVLGLLNRLIFLSRGQVVYSGSPSNLPTYLADFGHPTPEDENPSEATLDLICDLQSMPKGITSLVQFNRTWQNIMKTSAPGVDPLPPMHGSSLREAIVSSISRGKLVSGATNHDGNITTKVQTFANPFWKEILVLSKRSFLNSRRLPELHIIRFGVALLTAIIYATVYWQLDVSPKGSAERISFLGFAVATIFYICAEGWGSYLEERSIVIRETAYNAYRKYSYLLSHALVWLPPLFLLSITFSVITFFGVGLDGGFRAFLFYWGMIFASFWTGNSFVTLIVDLVPQVLLGFTVVTSFLAYFLFFCGLYISRDRIPSYWIWFHYLSLNKYPFQALLQNEFGDPSKCFVRAIQSFDSTPMASASVESKEKFLNSVGEILGTNFTGSTCVTTGADILRDRGITDLGKWESFGIIIAWGVFFRILFYLALLRRNRNKRK